MVIFNSYQYLCWITRGYVQFIWVAYVVPGQARGGSYAGRGYAAFGAKSRMTI